MEIQEHFKNAKKRSTNERLKTFNQGGFNRHDNEKSGLIVINKDKATAYNLKVKNRKIVECDCPHHHFRGVVCKHMVQAAKDSHYQIDPHLLPQNKF